MFGDRLIMKVYRVTVEGPNPEVEILRFLADKPVPTPKLAGEIEWVREGHEPAAVAVLSTFIKSKGDAWAVTLEALRALLAGTTTLEAETKRAALLGKRTAELHRALASDPNDPAFAPEPVRGPIVDHARESLERLLDKLRGHSDEAVQRLVAAAPKLRARLDEVAGMSLASKRIRVHGDYHLGQVLVTPDDDFVIIDFEGEPARSLAERRDKSLPLRDVAGMLRSFDYAAVTAFREAVTSEKNRATIDAWRRAVSDAFVEAWRSGVEGSAAAPANDREARALLDLFLLDKAVYEVGYELDNRPGWLSIPVEGLLSLTEK
jgi:maltose alpha-D-glucosyltransferase/alpha-amylase